MSQLRFLEKLIEPLSDIRFDGDYSTLKSNPWFSTFDFNKAYNFELNSPFIPNYFIDN